MANYPIPLTSVNPNYLVHIIGKDENGNAVNIIATLPAEFQLSTQASWEPILDNGNIAGAVSNNATGLAQKGAQLLTGVSTNSLSASQLIWASTSPIEFTVRLLFNAVSDAQKEVMIPVQSLLSLTLPSSLDTGISIVNNLFGVKAPGPALGGSQYNVNMYIGRAFYFKNIIVKSVSATFDTMATNQGDFISVAADVEISTSRVYTKTDFNQTFIRTNTSGTIPPNVLS